MLEPGIQKCISQNASGKSPHGVDGRCRSPPAFRPSGGCPNPESVSNSKADRSQADPPLRSPSGRRSHLPTPSHGCEITGGRACARRSACLPLLFGRPCRKTLTPRLPIPIMAHPERIYKQFRRVFRFNRVRSRMPGEGDPGTTPRGRGTAAGNALPRFITGEIPCAGLPENLI